MFSPDELLEMVRDAIKNLPLDREPKGLYQPVKYVLSLGGKRLRPVLMLAAYNMYKDDVQNILPQAIGLEVYHNFTLLHDDVMDRAEVRRGKPCVHKVWNENTAILAGDTMVLLAYQLMAKCNPSLMPNIYQLFTQTAVEIGDGQQYDVDFETRNDVTEQEYIEMIRLKTSVLLACAVKMGALLAGAPETDANELYAFGEKVGLAFQLQDDFLDVYGDPKVFGKRIGGDIICNKKTYMLINAYNRANEAQRAELEDWINRTSFNEEEKIQAVTRLYNEIGIPELCRQRMDECYRQAREHFDRINLPSERKDMLWQYVAALINRNH